MENIDNEKRGFLYGLRLNRIIWFLTVSDIFTWGFYLPLISLIGLYLSRQIDGNSVEIVGVGVGIYYIVRSLSQIPIGLIIDKIQKDRDDIFVLMAGNLIMGIPFLIFPLIQNQETFFILQAFMGLGASMNLVSWRKLFAKSLDRNREGTSYAVYDTILSLSTGIIAAIMGVIANINKSYFDFVMIFSGLVIISSVAWPVMIYIEKKRRNHL